MDHVYKKLEVTGSSTSSIDDAVRTAIQRTGENVDHLRWFEVDEIRGHIEGGEIAHWQVTVRIGFTVVA